MGDCYRALGMIEPWADTGLRWKRVKITRADKAVIRGKDFYSSFYHSAKEFSQEFGKPFAEMVLAQIPSGKRATVVIAMGGAEHLGSLLEAYIMKFRPNVQIDFRYVPAPTRFFMQGGPGTMSQGEADGYFSNFDLMKNDQVIVVDTGLRGTIVDLIAGRMRSLGYEGAISGALLAKVNTAVNDVPVFALDINYAPTMDNFIGEYFPSDIFKMGTCDGREQYEGAI